MWARAKWIEGDRVIDDSIPNKWVDEKSRVVYWPLRSATKLMLENKTPEKDWKRFELLRKKLVDDDLELCKDYNYTTANDSDNATEASNEEASKETPTPEETAKLKIPTPPKPPVEKTPTKRKGESATDDSPSPPKKKGFEIDNAEKSTIDTETVSRSPKSSKKTRSSNAFLSLRSPLKKTTIRRFPTTHFHRQSVKKNSPTRKKLRLSSSTSTSTSQNNSTVQSEKQNPDTSKALSDHDISDINLSDETILDSPQKETELSGTFFSSTFDTSRGGKDPEPPSSDAADIQNIYKILKKQFKMILEIRNWIARNRLDVSNDPSFSFEQMKHRRSLGELEEKLADQEFRQKMISYLGNIGGAGYGDHTRNILSRLCTNRLMAKMNFSGNNAKFGIRNTKILALVVDSVRIRFKNAVEHEICVTIRNYLRNAPARRDGGGRASNSS